ncbi:SDR family NAD(P)-dependent oxidoreductase [Murdochiella vaginalis]|uniref:SDR family NAD(P)-dependent oxidoreductase n=1 Tax=Murdochiella vaginalis TaxID=1852373 RepID=UPI0009F485F7|nr:SDR family NAD(P)-dependent oxidoreductase [Murdochiella vaginalis]
MQTIAIITGASSGLGWEFATQLDATERVDAFWLIARRRERLEALADTLTTPARSFAGDLTDPAFLETIRSTLQRESVQIATLVNSAGLGKIGKVGALGEEENAAMIELNVLALSRMTSLCLPYMQRGGRIFQLASVAAFSPQPTFAVYAATKSFVLSYSRALHRELQPQHITVTAVCPNPVETEFFDHAGSVKAASAIKKIGVEQAHTVVQTALRRAEKGKDISLSSGMAKCIHVVTKLLPHRFVLWAEKCMGLY